MSLRGSTRDFPLESVIGLLAGTSKTGELQVRDDDRVGALGFASGRLVAAVMESETGDNALGPIFALSEADFEFTPWESPPDANLEAGDLVALLKRAAEARDRLNAIRELIPNDRIRFRLSEKAADQGAVTFTPERWRALLAVNGERDVLGVAEQLRLGKMQTLTLLAGLVKDGVIETIAPSHDSKPARAAAVAEPEPAPAVEPEPIPEAAAAPEPQAEPPTTTAWTPPPEETSPAQAEAAPAWRPEPEPEEPKPAAAESDWSSHETRATAPDIRADLDAELSQRFGGLGSAAPESPPAEQAPVPPAVDDRLSTLSSLFAPGPAAAPSKDETRAPEPKAPAAAPARAAESWMPPPPAATETPANAWAPGTPVEEKPATADPWGQPITAPPPQPAAPPSAGTRIPEWSRTAPVAPPPTAPQPAPAAPRTAPVETPADKKKGGFFSRFRKEEPVPAPITRIGAAPPVSGSKAALLASLSNALLLEYSGYGKGKLETRLANRLMRVDEQADPIDRPLPVVDDQIDAAALERESFAEEQAVPYLATLVRQIYEDAEQAFGKERAKKGYRTAQQQVFGGDAAVLQAPDLAGKLPKV